MEDLVQAFSDTLKDKSEEILKVLREIKEEIQLIKQPGVPIADEELEGGDEVVPSPTDGDQYEFADWIGSGAYGSVYAVKNKKSKKIFAMKVIPLAGSKVNKNVAREISLLMDSQHDNIVRVQQVFISSNSMNLLMDYIPKNLGEEMQVHSKKFQDLSVIKEILKQLLSALAYLHNKPVIHRDVKPDNILIDDDMKFLLADFGFARVADSQLTPRVTTLQYRAPEVLLGSMSYTTAVDIWAVGCIFAELLVSSPAFTEGSEYDVIVDIFSKLGKPTEEKWPGLHTLPDFQEDILIFPERELEAAACLDPVGKALLLGLLAVVPSERITAEDALKHPFLSSE